MPKMPMPWTPASWKLMGGAALVMLLQACATPAPAPGPKPFTPPPAPPTSSQGVTGQALGGRMVADAQEYPWSALGRVNLAGQGFCTGIVIGPEQVLTQARCLYSAREGRWFQPFELHFIAAYQRDGFLADSKIAGFDVAPGFSPGAGTSLSNVANNWAVVSLQQPIGAQTGWLGLEWDGPALANATRLRAGYRQDWPHAVSLHFGCAEEGGAVQLCAPTPTELALPPFAFTGGELRVLADFYAVTPSQGGSLARLTGGTISDRRLGSARPPSSASAVGRRPSATAEKLLASLGYDAGGGRLDDAADAFRRDNGLPPGGGVDLTLLAALVSAAQRSGR